MSVDISNSISYITSIGKENIMINKRKNKRKVSVNSSKSLMKWSEGYPLNPVEGCHTITKSNLILIEEIIYTMLIISRKNKKNNLLVVHVINDSINNSKVLFEHYLEYI